MTNKLNTIPPTDFKPGMGTTNSGVGLHQLPVGHRNLAAAPKPGQGQLPEGQKSILGGTPLVTIGAAMNGANPGERPQNTNINSNWLKDPRFKR